MILFFLEQIAGLIVCCSFALTLYFYIQFKENQRVNKKTFSSQFGKMTLFVAVSTFFYIQSLAERIQPNTYLELEIQKLQIFAPELIDIRPTSFCDDKGIDSGKSFCTEINRKFLQLYGNEPYYFSTIKNSRRNS